jgi:hypothetical protein
MSGRVVVTGPATRTPVRTRWPVTRELDDNTELGAVYLRSLMRAQFLLALRVTAVVLAVVGGLPLVFALGPMITRLRMAGVPVPWLVLGACIQPVWIAVAAWHVRQAERVEEEFTELVERS